MRMKFIIINTFILINTLLIFSNANAQKPDFVIEHESFCEAGAAIHAKQAFAWKMHLLKTLTTTNENSKERVEAVDFHRREKEKVFDQNYIARQNLKQENKLSKVADLALSLSEQLAFTYATEHLDASEVQIRRETEFECVRVSKSYNR